MKARRIYRKFPDPSCPLLVKLDRSLKPLSSFTHIHWHPEPELIYVEQGEFEIFDEDGPYLLSAGDVCFLPPTKIHALRNLQDQGMYWSISFSMELLRMSEGHFFQKEFVNGLQNGTLSAPKKLTPELPVMDKVKAALELVCHGSREEQFLGLLSFWIRVMPLCYQRQPSPYARGHSAVEACIQYMNTNFADQITLEELGKLVHLHPNYLCAIFKKYAGTTVMDYLSALRCRKARRMLRQGNMSVGQVAEFCGFQDLAYFSRRFKALSGLSPTAYQKLYHEN